LDAAGMGLGAVAESYERDTGFQGSVRRREYLDQLRNKQLVMMVTASWCLLAMDCAWAQAVSSRYSTSVNRVQSRGNPCWMCVRRKGTWAVLPSSVALLGCTNSP